MRALLSDFAIVVAMACAGLILLADTSFAVSPGVKAGETAYDMQFPGTLGRQIALNQGSGIVVLLWAETWLPDPGLYPHTSVRTWSQNLGTWIGPHACDLCGTVFCQGPFTLLAWQPNLAMDRDGSAQVARHWAERLSPWPWSYVDSVLNYYSCGSNRRGLPDGSFLEPVCPRIDADQNPAPRVDVFHVAGCDTMTSASGIYYYVYWRFDGSSWSNPVLIDSGYTVSQLVVADPATDKVAYVFCRPLNYASTSQIDNDIAVYKSPDNGLSWVTTGTGGSAALTNVTNYATAQNGRAYTDLSAVYDFNGVLHIVWNEQRFIPPDSHFVGECELVLWDDASTAKRPIARAFWDNPASNGQYSMNLCKMTLSAGNGWTTCNGQSNNNYLYVTYTRFGGPTAAELADHSSAGYMNGETYLSISADGGHTWAPPRNLTNTKTPGCNPATGDSCASEHWATIAKTVDDTIHISYILDRDAGAAPLGEGTWTYNPVMYLRIPGGPDGALCPEIAAVLEYLLTDTTVSATQSSKTTTVAKNLSVDNYGNAQLSGSVSIVYTNPPNPPSNWLTVGGAQTQGFGINAGTAGIRWLVVASDAALDTATYHAEIRIAHNDPHRTNPQVIPIQIVGPSCICRSQGDVKPDGVPDVFDVVSLIDYAFAGGVQPPKDSNCPHVDRGDVNCDGVDDVLDVVGLIDYVFSGGKAPCNPCACTPYPTHCP